jgi:MFS transporter, AAHS family, 4-hydroxybenzoate transporter
MKTIDVGEAIDQGRWTGYQKLLIIGTALTIILDGVDNQLLPNTVPTLIKEWGQPGPAFANALAFGPAGMMIGGIFGGIIGDRLGRRTALMFSVVAFGVVTFAISFVNDLTMLAALRFLAGLGLGGAMPNAASLASEYVPRRQRPFAVTLTIVCIPLGGFIAADLAGRIIPTYGWRMLFQVGGGIPLVLALILWFVLPESPRYLAQRKERWGELTKMMRRIGHNVPDDVQYVEAATGAAPVKVKGSMGDLFTRTFARDTVAIWASFFFCLMVNYVAIQRVPTMLAGAGFTQAGASQGLKWVNIGGVTGALLGALAIQAFGSRLTMLGMCAAAIVCSLVMVGIPLNPQDTMLLMAMFFLTGGLLNAVQTTMYALAAHIYPTEIRGRGVGAAVAFGRIGNILAVYVADYALRRGGSSAYFTEWAVLMGAVLLSLAVIRNHVPRSSSLAKAHAGPMSTH